MAGMTIEALRKLGQRMTGSLTGFGWAVATAGVLCLVGYAAARWHEPLAAGIVCEATVLISLVAASLRPALSVSLTPPAPRMTEGEALACEVIARAGPRRPSDATVCVVRIDGADERFVVPRLSADVEHRLAVPAVRVGRGVILIGPAAVEHNDPFSLTCRRHGDGRSYAVSVRPRIVPFASPWLDRLTESDGDGYGPPALDDWDMCDMRDYRDGDDPRRIHWPTSLRNGTLMVRRDRTSYRSGLTITLLTDAGRYRDTDEFETAVRTFASIGAHVLAQGGPVSCQAGSWRADPRGVQEFLDGCSTITQGDDTTSSPGTGSDAPHIIILGAIGAPPQEASRRFGADTAYANRLLLIEVHPGIRAVIRRTTGALVGTVATVDDLPAIMEALP